MQFPKTKIRPYELAVDNDRRLHCKIQLSIPRRCGIALESGELHLCFFSKVFLMKEFVSNHIIKVWIISVKLLI